MVAGRIGIATFPGELFLGPLLPGTYETYRAMRQNPTIALARAVVFGAMRAAPWAYEAKDDAPDGALDLVKSTFERLKERFLQDSFRALDYGFQAFEKVWKVDRDGYYVFEKIKPLVPDWVFPLIDNTTGQVVGLRAGTSALVGDNGGAGEELGLEKMLWITYDNEAGDPFGRSRHENIRRHAWKPWIDMNDRIRLYASKGAGTVPIVHYPVGTSMDATGATVDNSAIAQSILIALGRTHGVTIPSQLERWAEDMVTRAQAGANIKDLLSWRIEFMEAATGHGTEFLEILKHYESLMMRGWLTPERAAIEGNYGTKAEAGAHGLIGEAISETTLSEIISQLNTGAVDQLLRFNFGPDAEGTVRIVPGPLMDEDQQFFRDLLKQVLVNPANTDLLSVLLDLDQILDLAQVPKRKNTDPNQAVDEREPKQPEPDPQNLKDAQDARDAMGDGPQE